MIHFYPGPSKLHADLALDMSDALASGILSMHHRSKAFQHLYQTTESLTQDVFKLPTGYSIAFASSATECWQIIAQSLQHLSCNVAFNGSFGEKWSSVIQPYHTHPVQHPFDITSSACSIPLSTLESSGLLCLTQVETSNGSEISMESFRNIRTSFKGIIAVDATSAMGGIDTDFSLADIWFASVQKCFGLPSGLALIILSPAARAACKPISKGAPYHHLTSIISNAEKYQTTHTPNILGIYLLKQRLARWVHSTPWVPLRKQMEDWYTFFQSTPFQPLVLKTRQSATVLALQNNSSFSLNDIIEKARIAGIILGKGYGVWSESTFRIANFPAHTEEDRAALIRFIQTLKM
ncbi:MAG: aminotransferase class V-fold PLP-dependent enzyme [Cytophagaceae bacterium]|jgi:phosphoserine aminotransferase|nr:aminotransferase class V-fold PLP-dependent enzyme [Cytophagaceae bacterium]